MSFQARATRFFRSMRYFTLLCTLLFPLSAIAQPGPEDLTNSSPLEGEVEFPATIEADPSEPILEASIEEGEPAASPEAGNIPAAIQISDQDYLLLPEEPSAIESENALSGEVIPAEEILLEPMEFEDLPPPPIDPRALAASSEAEERRLKIRYKQARLKAEKNPALIALLDKAKTARTFEGERASYRAYYRDLFRIMRNLDSSIVKQCDLMEETYLNRLAQTLIEPTIPLEPPPKPELLAN